MRLAVALLLVGCGGMDASQGQTNDPIPTPIVAPPYPPLDVDAHAWTVHVVDPEGVACDGEGSVALVDSLDLAGSWTGSCGSGELSMHEEPGIPPQLMHLTIAVRGALAVCERVARLEGQWMSCFAFPPGVLNGYDVLLRAK